MSKSFVRVKKESCKSHFCWPGKDYKVVGKYFQKKTTEQGSLFYILKNEKSELVSVPEKDCVPIFVQVMASKRSSAPG